MQEVHRSLAILGTGLLSALFIGLLWNRKARQCWTFFAYIATATAFSLFLTFFPGRYTPSLFLVKQGIYDGLLFGMAIELSIKAFAAFNGVANRVRVLLAMAVIVSTTVVAVVTPAKAIYADMSRYQPGVTTGGIWCLAFVALLIVWYQIPVPPFTRSIILGYVPYLVIFVVYTDLIGRLGWGAIKNLNVANAAAYDLAAGYWVFSAWRKV